MSRSGRLSRGRERDWMANSTFATAVAPPSVPVQQTSLLNSLLAGNLGREWLAPDSLHHHIGFNELTGHFYTGVTFRGYVLTFSDRSSVVQE